MNGDHIPTNDQSDRRTKQRKHQDNSYSDWRQVAGYFDGDGVVNRRIGMYVVSFSLGFSDTWKPQLESVQKFLEEQRIICPKISGNTIREGGKATAYRLYVVEIASVLRMSKEMLSYTNKKREDLRIVIDYLEDRISGTEAMERLNELTRAGRRSGDIVDREIPWTRRQGHELITRYTTNRMTEARKVKVPQLIEAAIRDEFSHGKSILQIARSYGYGRRVVTRILKTERHL